LYEFAVALPVLAIMLVGIIYSGITFYDYVVLAEAVSASARVLATSRNAATSSDNGCQLAENALISATQNLTQANLTILATTSLTSAGQTVMAPVFTGTTGAWGTASTPYYSTCSLLLQDDTVVVGAAYACNLQIPFMNANLCPLAKGAAIQTTVYTSSGQTTVTLGTCPFTNCISSITTVRIE
jgi:Flp pilus assembly protein TadG